jgi:hypothetical protein
MKNQEGIFMSLTEFRLSDDMMISYYGEIAVGESEENNQKFKVLFDTGSTDLFIPDESCTTPSCMDH